MQFRPWGVRLSISVPINARRRSVASTPSIPAIRKSPRGGVRKIDEIYAAIPDFAGVVVKADSEGQPGPSQVRPHAGGRGQHARRRAQAARRHGAVSRLRLQPSPRLERPEGRPRPRGLRHFSSARRSVRRQRDRPDQERPHRFSGARAGVAALRRTAKDERSGRAADHAGIHGAAAASRLSCPRSGRRTSTSIFARTTASTPFKDIVDGKTFHRPLGGYVGVANVGLDANWLAHPLAMANLYGFGRLAWNPNTTAETIAADWTRLTFSNDPKVVSTVSQMLLSSWQIYEHYTGPLGLQTLTNITGPHYGPAPQSQENNGWGQWIRADHDGRGHGSHASATGTGFIGQYPPEVAAMYTSLKTCPDNLLLFMHHEPYTYRLHDGQDGHPDDLRRPLPGRRMKPQAWSAQWQTLRRPDRSRALRQNTAACWNTRPATRSCGATRSTAGSRRCRASPTTRTASITIPIASSPRRCSSTATRQST